MAFLHINMYKLLAKLNRIILPSFTKKGLDMAKANKWQLAIIGWRYFVTTRALASQKSKAKSN